MADRVGEAGPESVADDDLDADLVTGTTIGSVAEAIGIARAASDAGMPAVISFTVGEHGTLPDGASLAAAVTAVDDATEGYPAYYMVNCARPEHIAAALDPARPWARRVGGLRANGTEDGDDPAAFAQLYRRLLDSHPHLTVLGGCCDTDVRHVQAIATACL